MHAYTTYHIEISGAEENIRAVGEVLKNKITDVEYEIGNEIHIYDTYDCVFEEDVLELAKELARVSKDASFSMKGCIDTSESAGELKDFEISFAQGKLTSRLSDWYVETSMDSFEDYEDFCDSFFECTEEEYEAIKDKEFIYLLETMDGDKLSDHVPLGVEEILEY